MSSLATINEIKVTLDFGRGAVPVGRLAIRGLTIYFEYHAAFIASGLNISPARLPFQAGLQTFGPRPFDGLPGVFNDSLPDDWGRLLIDRLIRSNQRLPEEFSPLDRLAFVGTTGLGALCYEPDYAEQSQTDAVNLDDLALHAQEVLEGEATDVLQHLINLNGSSAGARPKALIGIGPDHRQVVHGRHSLPAGYTHWLVKFPNSQDGTDAGAIEYVYALMAKAAGLVMTDAILFPAGKGPGYFATRRFDRVGRQRLHTHTASGLLHADFRTPTLDYQQLLALTAALTQDVRQVEKMYRLAVFNVLAHNRDDHGKNFTFLMDSQGQWTLSPAYDLTFSSGPRGQQSTMVLGEGQNPTTKHLVSLGKEANISPATAGQIIDQTRAALAQWPSLAKQYGVSTASTQLINSRLLKA